MAPEFPFNPLKLAAALKFNCALVIERLLVQAALSWALGMAVRLLIST